MILLEGISRVYRVGDQEVHALREVDLEVGKGDYLAIMGPSGSGKSTLLHLLGLLDRPSAGRYLLDGDEVSGLDDKTQARLRREKIGFVFQFFHLVPRMTAAQNVELPLILAGVPPSERKDRVSSTLDSFGLADRAGHRPDQLSGGQRQRVAIARATILEPDVILADEPTGNLDTRSSYEIMDIMHELHDRGRTIVMVTHDPDIAAHTQRTICVRDGQVIYDGRDGAGNCAQGIEGG
jgi:putative ABC transport system ATP-binding protein